MNNTNYVYGTIAIVIVILMEIVTIYKAYQAVQKINIRSNGSIHQATIVDVSSCRTPAKSVRANIETIIVNVNKENKNMQINTIECKRLQEGMNIPVFYLREYDFVVRSRSDEPDSEIFIIMFLLAWTGLTFYMIKKARKKGLSNLI